MESEVGELAGWMGLLLHIRPSELLGLEGSGIRSFLLDAALLARAADDLAKTGAEGPARSTKELVRRRRARWRPPRGQPMWD